MSLTHLVGYDGSDASMAALRFAHRLALPADAIVAANVLSEQLGPGAWAAAHARAEQLLEPTAELATQRRVVEGPTAHGLHDLAVELAATVLAIGATHRGSFGRLVPGSVGERLIHAAPCPLMVVPSESDGPIATVGVAFDGRAAGRPALEKACEIAQEQGAQLMVLTASEVPSRHAHLPRLAHRGAPVDVEATIAAATELIGPDVGFGHRVVAGPAGPGLVGACAEDVDLLVVGSRGYGPLHSVLAGSVTRHLVDHAPCPVLVVPRAPRSGDRIDPAQGERSSPA